jgi:hypothetical protein
MQKILITCIMVCTLSALAFSQDNNTYFDEGSKAVLFEFSGLSNLGANAFNGGIGGKYFIKSDIAIRGGVQFATISEDIPFQGSGGIDGERSATQFGFGGAVEVFIDTGRVNPYYGGGFGVTFTSTESKSEEANPADQVTIKNNRNGEFGYLGGTEISIYGIFGVEVFIIKNLSLAAEYRLGFADISRKDEERTVGNTTVTTKQGTTRGFALQSAGVLTLAVYF